jgi:acyl carrier protein
MSIEADLQSFIASEVVVDAGKEVGLEEPLIRTGRIDSMGLLQILGFIQQRYGVDLAATGGPSDFETVTSLARAIRRSRGEG